jgi:type IV pilus assembly protein PilY1
MKRIASTFLTAVLAGSFGISAHADVNIAPKPLSMSTGQPPNILVILDNSNTMAEGLTGVVAADCPPGPDADCVAGAASPESKSEMIREVARGLLDTYRGQVSMGLMAYQQQPLGSSFNDIFNNNIWLAQLGNRLYDVSYNPANYDSSFSGSPWDSTTKAFRTPNPNDDGHIHYNIGVPGYGPQDRSQFCFTRDPGGGYLTESFRFRCFGSKIGTSDVIPPDVEDPGHGYSHYQNAPSGSLTDSARARGVTHWGQQMVFLQYNHPEWLALGSPGRGYLHTPIRLLDEAQAQSLSLKLAPQHHDTDNANLLTDPNEPVIVAGLTPLQGTLLTARDYFLNQTTNFGAPQGRGNAEYPLPNSCDVNSVIWLTDGMPSVSIDGSTYGADVEAALSDAVAAATALHNDTNADIYVVGFAMPPAVPDDALERLAEAGGTSMPFLANDPQGLFDAVNEIFQQIIADSMAEFGGIDSGAVLRSGDLAFRTMADPSDWTGDVLAVREVNGQDQVHWRASTALAQTEPDNRNLFTDNGAFDIVNSDLLAGIHDDPDHAMEVVRYLRGDTNLEIANGGSFQNRSRLVGAIVGSDPTLQRPTNFAWDRLREGQPGAGSYNDHVEAKFDMRDVVYVGSNNGMLHAFDAENGEELFAYVPRGVWSRLEEVANPVPDFIYTVDGSAMVTDAYLPDRGGWRTILLGSTGAGGRSAFAIDVTNPEEVSADSVLWEVTAEDLHGTDAGTLGYTFATPQAARLEDGDWVAVLANGYGSDNNDARLLVLDLETGDMVANVLAASGNADNPNGLSAPRVARERPSELFDRWVYAGDLHGSLWRFDLNNLNNGAARLFQGTRPITAAPQTSYPTGSSRGFIVSFGTGKFFEVGDNAIEGAPNEYFYLIHDIDPEDSAPNLSIGDLENRSFDGASTGEQDDVDLDENSPGWYVNLGSGAKLLFQPRVLAGMVLFSSFSVDPEPCSVGGTNEAYLLHVQSGTGAFGPDQLARVSDLEGPPSRASFSVRVRPPVGPPGHPDPDPEEDVMEPEIVVQIGDHEIVVEGEWIADLAANLADGRRTHWLQIR